MRLNLPNINYLQAKWPRLLAIGSFGLLFTSLMGLSLGAKSLIQTLDHISLLQKEGHQSAYLINAELRLKSKAQDIEGYLKQNLENLTLLSDLKHRHEQDLHPSMPLLYNPKENSLKHNVSTCIDKHGKKFKIALARPVFLDEEDLKQLFSLVENKSIFPYQAPTQAPYVYFTSFELKKHMLTPFEKVFEITYALEGIQK